MGCNVQLYMCLQTIIPLDRLMSEYLLYILQHFTSILESAVWAKRILPVSETTNLKLEKESIVYSENKGFNWYEKQLRTIVYSCLI